MPFPLLSLIDNVIDKIVPDREAAMKLKNEAKRLEQAGEFKELDAAVGIIMSEAKSKDKWTSRARPSFLYVMYTYILSALPMGVIFAFRPEVAKDVAEGVGLWLQAIPPEMWALFAFGYGGYVKKRSDDKKAILEARENNSFLSKLGKLF